MNFEPFFNNLIFSLLFITVVLQSRFLEIRPAYNEKNTFFSSNQDQTKIGVFTITLFLSFFLSYRWFESGHPPLSNLYESLLFLTWTFLVFFLLVMKKTKKTDHTFIQDFLGFLLLSIALFLYTFATWRLPDEMQTMTPLVPALQSNWLLMHVSIMLLSYSSLLAGSLCSMSYLFVFYFLDSPAEGDSQILVIDENTKNEVLNFDQVSPMETSLKKEKTSSKSENSFLETKILTDLDQYSYQSLSFGFPLLTLGIISGAVWANEAWGSYWSWDPKETWAFITWLIFALYLHVRMNKGWGGVNAAWVATFGFFMVWICYLGVNLLGKGLHSYGWWQN
jgi:cytochrome c-type biogenesis protein CcsB